MILRKRLELALSTVFLPILGTIAYPRWTLMQFQLLHAHHDTDRMNFAEGQSGWLRRSVANNSFLQTWLSTSNMAFQIQSSGQEFRLRLYCIWMERLRQQYRGRCIARGQCSWYTYMTPASQSKQGKLWAIFKMTTTMESSDQKLKDLSSFRGREDRVGWGKTLLYYTTKCFTLNMKLFEYGSQLT